jgi:hypothetical protein
VHRSPPLFRETPMRKRTRSVVVALAAAALAGILPGCRDQSNPVGPSGSPAPGPTPGAPNPLVAVECVGSLAARTVTCGKQTPAGGPSADLIVGEQNVYVKLTSSGVAYNSGTGQFTFTTTVQNLIPQPLGTTDGTTLDPSGVRIFFNSGPTMTSGAGTASVLPDGFATFLAPGQPYYQYNQVLPQGQTSAGKTWTLIMPPTVLTFAFTVYVSAPVEYPNGYIALDGQLPEYSYGSLHPGATHTITPVVRTAVGNVVPGAVVTFGSTNPACATVDANSGLVTGVGSATCSVTATSGALTGSMSFDVTGAARTWNGSVSTEWTTAANWDPPAAGVAASAPAATDSVAIPGGMPRYPLLSGATAIGGIDVANGGSISLSSFDLTASQNVSVATGGSISGTTGRLALAGGSNTASGAVGTLLVTGTYSASGDVTASGPVLVRGGLLKSVGYRVFVQ